jgi:hypothetical protein
MGNVLDGVDDATVLGMIKHLGHMKENLRRAIQNKSPEDELRYG